MVNMKHEIYRSNNQVIKQYQYQASMTCDTRLWSSSSGGGNLPIPIPRNFILQIIKYKTKCIQTKRVQTNKQTIKQTKNTKLYTVTIYIFFE